VIRECNEIPYPRVWAKPFGVLAGDSVRAFCRKHRLRFAYLGWTEVEWLCWGKHYARGAITLRPYQQSFRVEPSTLH
jgi:hypothetical protein